MPRTPYRRRSDPEGVPALRPTNPVGPRFTLAHPARRGEKFDNVPPNRRRGFATRGKPIRLGWPQCASVPGTIGCAKAAHRPRHASIALLGGSSKRKIFGSKEFTILANYWNYR